jgi:hypothetical protein
MSFMHKTRDPQRRAAKAAAVTMFITAGAVTASVLGAAAPANADVNRYLAIAYSPATGQWATRRACSTLTRSDTTRWATA